MKALFDWVKEPFKTPLDITHLFLLVGVVLVSIVAWNLILYHLRLVAEEVV